MFTGRILGATEIAFAMGPIVTRKLLLPQPDTAH